MKIIEHLKKTLAYFKAIASSEKVCFCSEERRKRINIYYLLFIYALVTLRLLLTAHNEIYIKLDDDIGYLKMASCFYWGDNNVYTLAHLPVFPIFVAIVRSFRLPLHIALELVYCASTVFLLIALKRVKIPAVICAVVGIAIIFHPVSFSLNNRIFTATLLGPLMVAGVAATILCFYNRKKINIVDVIYSSVFWALAWNTRKESIIIWTSFLLFIGFLFVMDYKDGLKKIIFRTFFIFIIPLLSCLILSNAIKVTNKICVGAYMKSIFTAPGFRGAFKELQRIKTTKYIPYTPITSEARYVAYKHSPTFKKLEKFFEGDIGKGWAIYRYGGTLPKAEAPYEIEAGWIYWCMIHCLCMTGAIRTSADCDAFWSNVADELRSARLSNKYETRSVYVTFLDPEISNWISRVSQSMLKVSQLLWTPAVKYVNDPCNYEMQKLFDTQATRRSFVNYDNYVDIQGWVTSQNGSIEKIEICGDKGATLHFAPLFIRKDIDVNKKSGFNLLFAATYFNTLDNLILNIIFSDGRRHPVKIKDLKIGCQIQNMKGNQLVIGMDKIELVQQQFLTKKIQYKIESFYLFLTKKLSYLVFPCIFLFILSCCLKREFPHSTFVLLILATLVTARLAVFILLDATSWTAMQPRYIYPVMVLYETFLILIIWEGICSIHKIACLIKHKVHHKIKPDICEKMT
jgi:hypothetical protein